MKKSKKDALPAGFYEKWDSYARKRDAWTEYIAINHANKLAKEKSEGKKIDRNNIIYIG